MGDFHERHLIEQVSEGDVGRYKMFGLDFVSGVPICSCLFGLLVSLLLNYFFHPVDEVCAIIVGLLLVKAALALLPPPVQRFDEDGKPYYLHRRSEQDRLLEAVFGFGFSALGVGYTAPLIFNSHWAFALQFGASAVCLYFIYVKRIEPELVNPGRAK